MVEPVGNSRIPARAQVASLLGGQELCDLTRDTFRQQGAAFLVEVDIVGVHLDVLRDGRVEVVDGDLFRRRQLLDNRVAGFDPGVCGTFFAVLADGSGGGPDQFGTGGVLADGGHQGREVLAVVVLSVVPAVHADVEVHDIEFGLGEERCDLGEQGRISDGLRGGDAGDVGLALEFFLDGCEVGASDGIADQEDAREVVVVRTGEPDVGPLDVFAVDGRVLGRYTLGDQGSCGDGGKEQDLHKCVVLFHRKPVVGPVDVEQRVLDVGTVFINTVGIQVGKLQREITGGIESGGGTLLPGNRAVAGIESDDTAVFETNFEGCRLAHVLKGAVERGGPGGRIEFRALREQLGGREGGLRVGDLEDDRVGPLAVVLQTVREHGTQVESVGFLFEGRGGIHFGPVFEYAPVLPQHGDHGIGRGLDALEHEIPPLATDPAGLLLDDGIDGVLVFRLGEPDVLFVGHHPRTHAVDAFLVDLHPECDFAQTLLLFDGEFAVRLGADVEQEVAAFCPGFDQDVDNLAAGLVNLVLRLVLPGCAHGEVGLPGSFEGQAWDVEFGGLDGTASDNGIGLEFPSEVAELFGLAVEEDDVDLAVVRHEFPNLGEIEVHEAGSVAGLHGGDAALDVDVVLPEPPEIIGREIDTGRDTLGTEGVEDAFRQVALVGRAHDAEIGGLGVPHGESGVVLGGENGIFDAGEFGEGGPVVGFEFAGVEGFRKILEESAGVGGVGTGERVGDHDAGLGIDGPVDEEAEALVAEPFEAVGLVEGAWRDVALGVEGGNSQEAGGND